MRKAQFVLSVLLLVLLLGACAPQAAPAPAPVKAAAPAPAPAAPAPAAPAKPAWQEEWDRVTQAAKKEGRVVLNISLGPDQRRRMTDRFTSKYGVPLEAMSASSSIFAPKIGAEQRAGIYSGDVWISGSTSYREIPNALDNLDSAFILPELTEPELIKKTWYFGEFPWANKAHTALISLMDYQEPISINTNLVKAGEITAYRELLDPKWKGKMSILDPQVSGQGNMWFSAVLELKDVDASYMRELAAKQELFITRDRRLQVEWLARGKHSVALGPHTASVAEFIQLGAPMDRFNPGTPFISGTTSGIAMMKRQPHPNAAKVFLNWLLSQEGQTLHSQAVGSQSQRLDVPTSHLERSKVLKPGLKLYRADNEEFAMKRVTTYTELAKEIFGPFTK